MRVVTNTRKVRNRALIGRAATLGGFASLIGGLIYSWFGWGGRDNEGILISYAALIGGYILISVGKGNWMRFSLRPRPDEALALNLRSLDARHLLFNYVSSIPVNHLLATPNGLIVIESRPFVGHIIVRGERWSRRRGILGWLQFLSEGALGNPTRDALRGCQTMNEYLVERLGHEDAERIPIAPIVVFTHPRVNLEIHEPSIAVAHARDIRQSVRDLASGPKLPGDVARRLETLLLEESRPDGEPVSAGMAVDRRPKRRGATRAR